MRLTISEVIKKIKILYSYDENVYSHRLSKELVSETLVIINNVDGIEKSIFNPHKHEVTSPLKSMLSPQCTIYIIINN